MTARTEAANSETISRAAENLRRGRLVGIPTETVYGLAADAANDLAVAAIFAVKARPRFNPLIVHVRDLVHAQTFADFPEQAHMLATAFWPGPLTLVLPRRAGAHVSLLASAGLDTVALRAPAHEVAQELLCRSGLAIAAPSANRSGEISPTTAQHVVEGIGDAIDIVLDAGPSRHGIESTIVGFDRRGALLLRPGAVSRETIEAVVGKLGTQQSGRVTSPGQLRSHYAPRTPLRLDAHKAEPGEALLAFGSQAPAHSGPTRNLSTSGDLREAAANLFAMLRDLDAAGSVRIAVMAVPWHGLGEAINDRLRRASVPRDG